MEHLTLRRLAPILLLALAAFAAGSVIPEGQLHPTTRIIVLAGAAMSLNLLIGNAGLVSMGHGLFLGLGAYAVAIGNIKFHFPVAWCAAGACLAALLVAAIAGAVALRARALFFALLTLAIGQVFYVGIARSYSFTGGDDGLVGIDIPAWLDGDIQQYLLSVVCIAMLCVLLLAILASPFGATLRAARDNPDRVASLGGNPKLYEFAAFVIAGILATMLGALIAITNGSVEPGVASWTTGATLLVMVALGGRSSFLGPIIGAVILEVTRTYVQSRSTHADLAVGLIVIFCAVAMPEGICHRARTLFASRDGSSH